MVEESSSSDLSQSLAFQEYSTGERKKIKTPWITIIVVGIVTAALHLLTGFFAMLVLSNPYALNFIIGLFGIPAGFIIAFKNKTLSVLVSFQYAIYSAVVYTGVYFIVTLIGTLISSSFGIGNMFAGAFGVFLTSLVIFVYLALMFCIGALIGTFVHGVLDARR